MRGPGHEATLLVLSLCTIGLFFPLLLLAAYMLPGGLASTLQAASALAVMAISALGFVLIKRWPAPTDMVTMTSWQLVGGLLLLPIALAVEGAPPALDAPAVLGYAWVGTGVAYVCWFTGPRWAVIVMHEAFGPMQALGAGLVLGQPAIAERLRRRRVPDVCPAA